MIYEPILFDIETTGLNPLAQSWSNKHEHDGQVLSVGIGTIRNWRGNRENVEIDVRTITNENEYALLEDVRDYVESLVLELESYEGEMQFSPHKDVGARTSEVFLVGYNSRQFDHQYLCSRLARKRLDPFPFAYRRKRLDMFRVANQVYGNYIGQDDFYNELGYESDDPHDGGDMPDFWRDREMDKIEEHCRHDVFELCQIFLECRREAMEEFFDHYDVDREIAFGTEVDL